MSMEAYLEMGGEGEVVPTSGLDRYSLERADHG